MKLKITLIKSISGRLKDHIATAHSMGLRKIQDAVILEDNPAVRGKINKIGYLLKVEEVNE